MPCRVKFYHGKSGKHLGMLQILDHADAEPLVEKFWTLTVLGWAAVRKLNGVLPN